MGWIGRWGGGLWDFRDSPEYKFRVTFLGFDLLDLDLDLDPGMSIKVWFLQSCSPKLSPLRPLFKMHTKKDHLLFDDHQLIPNSLSLLLSFLVSLTQIYVRALIFQRQFLRNKESRKDDDHFHLLLGLSKKNQFLHSLDPSLLVSEKLDESSRVGVSRLLHCTVVVWAIFILYPLGKYCAF